VIFALMAVTTNLAAAQVPTGSAVQFCLFLGLVHVTSSNHLPPSRRPECLVSLHLPSRVTSVLFPGDSQT